MKIFKIAYLILIILFINCENNKAVINATTTDAFFYQSYDSTGILIVKGWLSLNRINSTQFNGDWSLEKIGNTDNIGPQLGDGVLIGVMQSNNISINLNPGTVDNNVILNGVITDGVIEGSWHCITIAGATNWGTFRANQNTGP